ncbi:UNVERIFIED_CONTAM: hypothetical protein HDU68_010344 [Siphonaria sp. JEL0065]|nr:hypothetical protein HDU68_010344 [Siphonaria sp. JEL0065]
MKPTLLLLASTVQAALTASDVNAALTCDDLTKSCTINALALSAADCKTLETTLGSVTDGFCHKLENAVKTKDCQQGLALTVAACNRAFGVEGSTSFAFSFFFKASAPVAIELLKLNSDMRECDDATKTCTLSVEARQSADCAVLRSFALSPDGTTQGFCYGLPTDIPSPAFSLHSICVDLYNEWVDDCFAWFYRGLLTNTFKFQFSKDPSKYIKFWSETTTTTTITKAATSATTTTTTTSVPTSTIQPSSCKYGDWVCSADGSKVLQCNFVYNADGTYGTALSQVQTCPKGEVCFVNGPNGTAGCTPPGQQPGGSSGKSAIQNGSNDSTPPSKWF